MKIVKVSRETREEEVLVKKSVDVFSFEVDLETAQALQAVLSKVSGSYDGPRGKLAVLFDSLAKAGVFFNCNNPAYNAIDRSSGVHFKE